MKKMVCEICGSQTLRKENGVFVCQECGTEYSLEEAKKLLKEIDSEEKPQASTENEDKKAAEKVTKNDDDKFVLLKRLTTWYVAIDEFQFSRIWVERKPDYLLTQRTPDQALQIIEEMEPKRIPTITDDYIKRVFDYAQTDEDIKNMIALEHLYNGQNVTELITQDSIVKVYLDTMRRLGLDHVFCNGQGPFPEYYFCLPNNYATGWSFEQLGKKPSSMYQLAIDNKQLIAVRDIIRRGVFGDKVLHEDASGFVDPNKLFGRIRDLRNQVLERHKEVVQYYIDNFEKVKNIYIETIKLIKDLEKEFLLPQKYRNTASLQRLITYIEHGRVDSWKEAVNLFETEQFREGVTTQLSNINNTLNSIDSNLKAGLFVISNQLHSINGKLAELNGQMSVCKEALTNIMFDTRYSLIRSII